MRAIIHLADRCIVCEHPISAVSREEWNACRDEHRDYVNTTFDRTTDPHFEEGRLTSLILL